MVKLRSICILYIVACQKVIVAVFGMSVKLSSEKVLQL